MQDPKFIKENNPDAVLSEESASSKIRILTETIRARDKQLSKLSEEIKALKEQKQEIEGILRGVLNSKSWRLTSKLRGIAQSCRSIFPLIKNRVVEFNAEPGRHAEKENDFLKVVGTTPEISLHPRAGAFPHSWVLVSADVECAANHLTGVIYYRQGEGFDGHHRFWFTCGERKAGLLHGAPILVRLPNNVKGLRFDPFHADHAFKVHGFRMQELGSLQIVFYLFKKQLGPYLRNPAALFAKLRKGWALYRAGGFPALRARLVSDQYTQNYTEWVEKYDTLGDEDFAGMKRRIASFAHLPRFSVIMPTYNTPEDVLLAAIESVRSQVYENWELCIADDASSAPHVKKLLTDQAAKDSRIKIILRETNGHIGAASNSALEAATGEFVAFLDHDDALRPHALYMVAEELNAHPQSDVLYSDEDKLTSVGMRFNPHFKSDWNPALLLSQNYVCHLLVIRKTLVDSVGRFRDGYDGAQDWDLILRATDATTEDRIRHIPHVLYHWRVIEGSTAQSTAYKPYVLEAQRKAVSDHLARRGIADAEVSILEHISHLKVVLPVPAPEPLVSIIIPTRNQKELLAQCVESILGDTTYRAFEIIIVDNGSDDPGTLAYFSDVTARTNVRVLHDDQPFNFSRINNNAARHANGELLAFLNNDLKVIEPGWLRELVSYAVLPEVGGVGARLLYPNNLLQHGGIILGIGGVAGHNHKGRPKHDPGYFNRAILPQNLSAVTAACLLMRRGIFEELGGFEEEELSVAFNDVDLCLRVRQKGYKIVYTPYAELYHYESASRGLENTPDKFMRFEGEVENMKRRWEKVLKNDPYYNPNLTLISEDFAYAFPPRAPRPWKEGRNR